MTAFGPESAEAPASGIKRCSRCRRDLPVSEFYRLATGRPTSECKVCRRRAIKATASTPRARRRTSASAYYRRQAAGDLPPGMTHDAAEAVFELRDRIGVILRRERVNEESSSGAPTSSGDAS